MTCKWAELLLIFHKGKWRLKGKDPLFIRFWGKKKKNNSLSQNKISSILLYFEQYHPTAGFSSGKVDSVLMP